ncbi:MAG: C10 family peptidase [Muribaculaceae bacterium]|nr:C10 family peptidase [Muribaculaceae bacterium]
MKRILIVLSLIFAVSSAFGRGISEQEAAQIAANFLDARGAFSRSVSDKMDLSLALPDNSNPIIYVFNRQNGGYAVVGADDRLSYPVLAYSENGHIDALDMPQQLLSLLEGYVFEIKQFGAQTPIKPTSTGKSVEPLIKTTWGQSSPYSNMTPLLENGDHCATGCANTAQAQIMNYYKYPKQGKGTVSYEWNNQTLSANLGESNYDWGNMLDSYSGSYDKRQADAVAMLMRDCGYANRTSYGPSSGAAVNYIALVENFGYDKGMRVIGRDGCTRNDYESFMRAELDAKRPILVSGGSSRGAHEFICDGYDSDGYFHYNFGWSGYDDGYYLTSATGFDSYPSIEIGIQPECGGEPLLFVSSNNDFLWDGDKIRCQIESNNALGSNFKVYFEFATISENIENGKKFPTVKFAGEDCYVWTNEMPSPQNLEDGTYIVYPAIRYKNSDWEKICFYDNRQNFIDLKVENGIYTYANNHIIDLLDDGKIEVDGIYYILSDYGTAKVTYKNDKFNSYSGDINIPDIVNVNNRSYKVTTIGSEAFKFCYLGKVKIGKNIKNIESGGFGCSIESIDFEIPSSLEAVEGWGFNGCRINELVLPDGVERLGMCAFQSSSLKSIDIPSSVKFIDNLSFDYAHNLKDVYVHWTKESELPYLPMIEEHIFNGCKWDEMTLHVPAGTEQIYRNAPQWSDLNIVEMQDESAIDEIISDDVNIVVSNNCLTIQGAAAIIYNIAGTIVATPSDGETVSLPHGVYIVKASIGYTKKVVI